MIGSTFMITRMISFTRCHPHPFTAITQKRPFECINYVKFKSDPYSIEIIRLANPIIQPRIPPI